MFLLFIDDQPAIDAVSGKPYGAATQEAAQKFLDEYILPRLRMTKRPGVPNYGYSVRETACQNVKIIGAKP